MLRWNSEGLNVPLLNFHKDFLSIIFSSPLLFNDLIILCLYSQPIFQKDFLQMPCILPHFPLIPWLTPVCFPFPPPRWNYRFSSYLYSQFQWTFLWTYLILTFDTIDQSCHLLCSVILWISFASTLLASPLLSSPLSYFYMLGQIRTQFWGAFLLLCMQLSPDTCLQVLFICRQSQIFFSGHTFFLNSSLQIYVYLSCVRLFARC